jgi:hypothetical protein
MPSQTVRIWISTVKTWSQRLSELPIEPDGLSTRTAQTVHQGLADRPRVGHGSSTRSTRAVHHSVCFEVNFRTSAVDPRTVRPGATFLEKLCQKPKILNKSQRPADRPHHIIKPTFLKIFNETFLSNEIATHLNAMHANSWSKWRYGKSSQWNWSLLIVRLSILSIWSFTIL